MDYLLEDFQEQDLTIIKLNKALEEIKTFLLSNYPFESGGLVDKDYNIYKYTSDNPSCHRFFPPNDFFLKLIRKQFLFSFHSHLHLLNPSEEDIFFIKNYDIPIIIYSLNWDRFLSVNIKHETSYFTWPITKDSLCIFRSQS
jgi:proteasome lid subunit RPN8/RPN11